MPEEILRTERPTVLIGLGGTGKQTLLYLRRMFFERYGVKTLPHVAMVVIDTDGREENLDGSKFNEFDEEVKFTDELVVTPVDQALKNFRENRGQYPHIDSWMDRALEAHGNIGDGAGQIRSLGRLAFFHHRAAIEERLKKAYTSVTDRETLDRSLRDFGIQIPDTQSVDTWLIFSVAGGTGSGMFLDVAFLAQQIGKGEARSVILLPTAFSSDLPTSPSASEDHRVFANSYAALMELETYNYQRLQEGDARQPTLFRLQWTPDDYRQRKTAVGPVFVNSWLVDNEPRAGGGQVNGERMSLCQMIAEWLFIQYGATVPALAGPIRSNRSNDAKSLTPLATIKLQHSDGSVPGSRHDEDDDEEEVTLLYSKRYSSFGLSKIYVPTTNLTGQAHARLVGDIAQLWLTDEATGDVKRALRRRLFPKVLLPSDGETKGYTDVLARRLSVDGSKEPFSRRFERLIVDQHQKLKARGFETGAETEARDWFDREIMDKLLDGSSKAAARRGEISVKVSPENVIAAGVEIKEALEAFIAETMSTQGERFAFTEEALKLTVKDYLQAVEQANQRAVREERKGGRLQKDIETLLIWAGDHRGFDRATLFQAAFDKMRDRATAEFRRQVFLATAKTAQDAADYIGIGRKVKDDNGQDRVVETGILSSLATLKATLTRLNARSRERISALRQQPASPLNSRAPAAQLERAGDVEAELTSIYKDANRQPIEREQLLRFEEELYKAMGHKGFTSPWYLKDQATPARLEIVFDDLLLFAHHQLGFLSARMEDAVIRFSQKFQGAEAQSLYAAELKRVVGRGAPWLPQPLHNMGGDERFRTLRTTNYVAISPEAAPVERDTLLQSIGDRSTVAGALDTVYFESEVAGVPLFAVRHMDLYRNAYLGHLEADDPGVRVVHNELDLEKFVDLLPFSDEEMRLRRRAIKVFIRAVVSGVLTPDPAGKSAQLEWTFSESTRSAARPVVRKLGRYITAIRKLSRPGDAFYTALVKETDRRLAEKLTQDDVARVFFAVEEMGAHPPIDGSEWSTAVASVQKDLRVAHGDSVVDSAKEAGTSLQSWGQPLQGASEHPPFWRLKALATV